MVNRVELLNISKTFGGIAALKSVTLKVLPGEIHALIGENGAGKSTLMKILSGAYIKDSGTILIDGKEVHFRNTRDSKENGIGIIYQEFSLVPDLSVAENVFLDRLGSSGIWMKWRKMNREATEIIRSIGFDIKPFLRVGTLSIAQQQVIEIAKALSEKVKILILDEPSAVLGPQDIQRLFDILGKLKKEGVSIIYISHHLHEIFQIADRVTVLKDGASGESLQVSETDRNTIIRLMLGRTPDTMYPVRNPAEGRELFRASGIRAGNRVNNVSISVTTGEILGIAGLVGSGRTETVRAIFAADKRNEGRMFLSGREFQIRTPRRAVNLGIGMVPEDRKRHGVILSLTVKHNISLTSFKGIANRFGFINEKKERVRVTEMIKKLNIKTRDENQEVNKLSGGNQQKVALAKWLNLDCRMLIVDEPTRGVDVGARIEIYNILKDLSDKGVSIILVSSDSTELLGICDRIIVMRKGSVQGELAKKDFSEKEILRLSIGA
jgi:ribose transport system ATP-binding protein